MTSHVPQSAADADTGMVEAQVKARIDQLIDVDAPWRQLRRYFNRRSEMLAYVATRLAQVHAPDRVPDKCQECAARVPDGHAPARFTWQYSTSQLAVGPWTIIELLVGHLPVPYRTEYLRFDTHHRFCPTCQAAADRRYALGSTLRPIALFLLAAGVMLSVAWAICVAVAPANAPNREDIERLGALGLPALLIGLPATRLVDRLRVPAALRQIGRRPFGLHRALWQ